MKTAVQNSLKIDNNIRLELINSLSIYSKGHIFDSIHNIETLKLFSRIDHAYKIGDKKVVFDCLNDFVRNEGGKFNSEYGKAKDHLESLIKCNNDNRTISLKITTYELFNNFGISDRTISSLGITRTSKTGMITNFFEFLTAETIKNKYIYVQDVIVCSPGKIQVPHFNGTKQSKFDLIVTIEDFNGNKINLAFDHKVKDLITCIKDIQKHGLKYSVYTLGDVEDHIFYESPAVKQCLLNYDYTEVYNSTKESNFVFDKIVKSEVAEAISSKNLLSETTEKVLVHLNEYENTRNLNTMLRTPAMLVSSRDLAKTIADLNARNSISGNDYSDSGFH